VALCQARISTKPLWGFSSSNPYHSQSRAEQGYWLKIVLYKRWQSSLNIEKGPKSKSHALFLEDTV
jgi:hypothetical protein